MTKADLSQKVDFSHRRFGQYVRFIQSSDFFIVF